MSNVVEFPRSERFENYSADELSAAVLLGETRPKRGLTICGSSTVCPDGIRELIDLLGRHPELWGLKVVDAMGEEVALWVGEAPPKLWA